MALQILVGLCFLPLAFNYDSHIAKDVALTADAAFILGSWDLVPLFESIKALDNFINVGLSAETYDDIEHYNYNVGVAKRAKSDLAQAVTELERVLGADLDVFSNRTFQHSRSIRASPLSWVSDIFDYTFGFIGNSKWESYKQSVTSRFQILSLKNEHLQMVVSSHMSAMHEVQLQLNDMTKNLKNVVTKVNLMFGTLTWSIRLEAGIAAINRACMMLIESKHRADGSYLSRYIISEELLGIHLLQLSDTSKYLHPIFGSAEVANYYKARCSVSSFNGSHFVTLVRIPLVSRTSMFQVVESPSMMGHLTLRNELGNSFIHYSDYISCLGSVLPFPYPTWCNVRPCISKSETIRCLAKNSTSIIVKTTKSFSLDISCPTNDFSVQVLNISVIHLPHHCLIDSTQLHIPKIQSSLLREIAPTIRSFDNFEKAELPGVIVKFLDQSFTKRLNLPEVTTVDTSYHQTNPFTVSSLALALVAIVGLITCGLIGYCKLRALATIPTVGHRLDDLFHAIA